MVVINRDSQFLEDLVSLEAYILSELNIRKMTVSQDKAKYGVHLKAEPNFRLLGARLKGDQKKVADYLKVSRLFVSLCLEAIEAVQRILLYFCVT